MFKHKCFIRKNNEFLRETLKKLGYIELNPNDNETIIVTNDGHNTSYFTTIEKNSIKNLGNMFIDCGTSETLFLGIAAITDEHDKFQFFTTLADRHWYNLGTYSPKGSLEFCMVTDRHMGKHPLLDNMTVPAKKSSIEDLIINFKDKEEDTEFYSKILNERWKKDIYDFEYYPLTEEEKKEINELLTKDENVEFIFSSASTDN
jgi:hypothetical protein